MVYLKVSDGSETRKLQVTPGEITFDQLKEQLATFFPKTLSDAGSGLSLQYRDADGDVITLSSDQELQEALSQLQEDGVWKLHIRNGQRSGQKSSSSSAQQKTQRGNHCEATSLFHRLFEPSVRPFGLFSDVWDDLEQHLQLLHQIHGEVFSNSSDAKTETKNSTTENQKKTSSEVPSKSEGEATATTTTEQQPAEDPDEVVKSKPQAAGSDKKEGNDGSADKNDSQWHTRRFVTWEPRVHVGPFGFFHSRLTPVVYKVTYKSSSDNGCCSSSSATRGDKSEAETKTEAQHEQTAGPAAEKRVEESATATESGVPEQPSEAATLTA